MGIALVAGLYAAFLAVVIIVWYIDEQNKRRARESDIKMKEREIIEKYVDRGGELPYNRKYEEIEMRR